MQDTICAISTALGVGAISIIKVSGNEAITIVNKVFKGKDLTKVKTHTIHYGFIMDKNQKIDEVLVTIMKAPKTFTTENIVEINSHGSIATTNKILELLLLNGVRLAEPGEFTKRAFLNGRIDLIEAESTMDLIHSKTETARKMAISGLEGNLSQIINQARKRIIEIRANIEVNIDYPEYEDELIITHDLLLSRLKPIIKELNNILKESNNGKIIKEGINICIIGRPNVGKSSILNHLLDEEKAIVTDIAGTTRDIIEGSFILNGIRINLIDTAGIRNTDDVIEKIGVNRSISQIDKADLILYVLNNNEKLSKEDLETIEKINNKKHLIIVNKKDLNQKIDTSKLIEHQIVYTNTVDKDGLNDLKSAIIELFNLEEIETGDFTYLSNARQISLIKIAIEYAEEALKQAKSSVPVDLIAIDIENCYNALSEIIGETYKEDLVKEIFSNFCLGK